MTHNEAIRIVRSYIREHGRSRRTDLLMMYHGRDLAVIQVALLVVCKR